MNKKEVDQAKEMMKRMKGNVREVLNKYANESSSLAHKSADPHSPVIAAMQMALANAAVDYMILCGCIPPEALQTVCNVTGIAMQQWMDTILRMHNLQAETATTKVEITDVVPRVN